MCDCTNTSICQPCRDECEQFPQCYLCPNDVVEGQFLCTECQGDAR